MKEGHNRSLYLLYRDEETECVQLADCQRDKREFQCSELGPWYQNEPALGSIATAVRKGA